MTMNAPTATAALEALTAAFELLKGVDLINADSKHVAALAVLVRQIKAFDEVTENEVKRRVLVNGEALAGITTKPEVKHRAWNDEDVVRDMAYDTFGLKAFKLLTPAAIEKLGAEGEALAAVASTKPEAGKRVVY
jgi:hypothetical protein